MNDVLTRGSIVKTGLWNNKCALKNGVEISCSSTIWEFLGK